MKASSQLIEGRNHHAQPRIGLHYPGKIRARARANPVPASIQGSMRRPRPFGPMRARRDPYRLQGPMRARVETRTVLQAKEKDLGDDLLFQTVASPVPSALTGLTAVFGMGTGVSPSLWSPKSFPSIAAKK